MKRLLSILFLLPVLAFGQTLSIGVDENGVAKPFKVGSTTKQPLYTFPNGITVNKTNLGLTKEVYISVRTDGPTNCATTNVCGSGTKFDPYDGSTAAKFDAVMASLGTYVTIHLAAGTFPTSVSHTWLIQTGWVIIGEDDASVIQATGSLSGISGVSVINDGSGSGVADYVHLSHFKVDCNWGTIGTTAANGSGGEKNVALGAIAIHGSHGNIEYVTEANTYGSAANNKECFGIVFGSRSAIDASDDHIRFCKAITPQGNYSNPWALVGYPFTTVSHITDSSVEFCTAIGINDGSTNGWTSGGVNLVNDTRCSILYNTFIDCEGIAHHDTGDCHDLKVIGNTLIRGWGGAGVAAPSGTLDSVMIADNRIDLQNRVTGGASYGIATASTIVVTNLSILRNVFTYALDGGGLADIIIIRDFGKMDNAKIEGNTMPTAAFSYFDDATKVVKLRGNHTPAGAMPPGLTLQEDSVPIDTSGNYIIPNDATVARNFTAGNIYGFGAGISGIAPAAGDVQTSVRTVLDANYTVLTTGDDIIEFTTLTAPRTVHLPAANTCARCVRRVTDGTGSASSHTITIDVTGSGAINGGTSTTITTDWGSKKLRVNSAATKWIIE